MKFPLGQNTEKLDLSELLLCLLTKIYRVSSQKSETS